MKEDDSVDNEAVQGVAIILVAAEVKEKTQ